MFKKKSKSSLTFSAMQEVHLALKSRKIKKAYVLSEIDYRRYHKILMKDARVTDIALLSLGYENLKFCDTYVVNMIKQEF